MKKIVLSLLFFLFLCSTQLFSQGVRYGFKLGLNVSEISNYEFDIVNVVGDEPITAFSSLEEKRYGFTAAFIAEMPLNQKLSFQPEFQFSTQGNKYDGVRYDNLQLPLGLKYSFEKLYVMVGPQAGIKISFYEQAENYKSIDFAAFGAVGYHINESIFVEARFTQGFLEIFEDDAMIRLPFVEDIDGEPTDNGNIANGDNFLVNNSGTNRFFTFSIGYRL